MASSLTGESDESLVTVVEEVAMALMHAGKYGLQAEVIATAMIFSKENPEANIATCLEVGLSDWDI